MRITKNKEVIDILNVTRKNAISNELLEKCTASHISMYNAYTISSRKTTRFRGGDDQ